MCCCLVRLLLVAMLATQHTDFESFTKDFWSVVRALGAIREERIDTVNCD